MWPGVFRKTCVLHKALLKCIRSCVFTQETFQFQLNSFQRDGFCSVVPLVPCQWCRMRWILHHLWFFMYFNVHSTQSECIPLHIQRTLFFVLFEFFSRSAMKHILHNTQLWEFPLVVFYFSTVGFSSLMCTKMHSQTKAYLMAVCFSLLALSLSANQMPHSDDVFFLFGEQKMPKRCNHLITFFVCDCVLRRKCLKRLLVFRVLDEEPLYCCYQVLVPVCERSERGEKNEWDEWKLLALWYNS